MGNIFLLLETKVWETTKKLEKYLNFRFEAKSSWGSGAGIVGDGSG